MIGVLKKKSLLVFLIGTIPYTYAQHVMTVCYSITHLTIHLKFDHGRIEILF